MLQVTFAEVVRVLEGLGSSVSAAEAHGCLVGALCTTERYSIERWLEEIIPDAPEAVASDEISQQALRLLYDDTLNALRGEDMQLEVLLPGDEISLQVRAGGLSQWCQGFLYGFGTGQSRSPASDHVTSSQKSNQPNGSSQEQEQLPANVNEILNDLTHIGRASVEFEGDTDNDNESEEAAYAEVVEYVRVGVQLIHDELIPAPAHRVALDEDVGAPNEIDEMGQRAPDSDDNPDIDPSILH